MTPQDKLSEKWPWNGEFLRLFLLIPGIVGLAATVAALPFAGLHSLWYLSGILVGVVFYLIYGSVGRRVEKLKQEFKGREGEVTEGLIVMGKLQSPGIVILRENEIELVSITGEQRQLKLADIKLIGEGCWLPGKYVWGKRVYTFSSNILNPLAFAVPESIGIAWSPKLREVFQK